MNPIILSVIATLMVLFSGFISILVHELGHAFAFWIVGYKVSEFTIGPESGPRLVFKNENTIISINPFLGFSGSVNTPNRNRSTFKSFIATSGGPFCSFLLLVLLTVLFRQTNAHNYTGDKNMLTLSLGMTILLLVAFSCFLHCMFFVSRNSDICKMLAYVALKLNGTNSIGEWIKVISTSKMRYLLILLEGACVIAFSISLLTPAITHLMNA